MAAGTVRHEEFIAVRRWDVKPRMVGDKAHDSSPHTSACWYGTVSDDGNGGYT